MKRKLLRTLLTISALALIFFAVKYSLANLSYLKVDAYLTRWQKTTQVEQAELVDAQRAVQEMLSRHGHFPHYLNVAAKVDEWQAYAARNETERQRALQGALRLYQTSTQLREQWPLTWVFMANIKAQLGEFDADFYRYIAQSIHYGPYTHQVNLQVAKLQLQYWLQLPGFPVKQGIEQIRRALINRASRNALLSFAREQQQQNIVCGVARVNDITEVLRHPVCRAG